jgi:hypothetical protein
MEPSSISGYPCFCLRCLGTRIGTSFRYTPSAQLRRANYGGRLSGTATNQFPLRSGPALQPASAIDPTLPVLLLFSPPASRRLRLPTPAPPCTTSGEHVHQPSTQNKLSAVPAGVPTRFGRLALCDKYTPAPLSTISSAPFHLTQR